MAYDTSFLSRLGLDGEVSVGSSDRGNHASDYGTPDEEGADPGTVVFAESTADVSAVLAAASEHGVPVTPYAAGTGLEGGATPVEGAISLDTTRMDAIIEIRPEDMQVAVEPGVFGGDLNDALKRYGLFVPSFPSSGDYSTIGGMVATDASGMKTVKYGEVSDWVLGLEVVLADGTVITTGSDAAKTSSGYNLTDLVVGSEGTLGIVTRVTLAVAGLPEQIHGGRAVFPTLADAAEAVTDAVTAGVDVAKLELVDETSARMANAYADEDLPEKPLVFVEFHADQGIDGIIDYCRLVFEDHAVEEFEVGSGAEMDQLWQVRKDLLYAVEEYDPELGIGKTGDVTVPIGEYPGMIRDIKSVADETGFEIPCFGHAGDGNVHYFVLADYEDAETARAARTAYADIVERALERRGTATGEHGIGVGKRTFMAVEHGADGVEAMRAVKRALDPKGILNPGTVLPESGEKR